MRLVVKTPAKINLTLKVSEARQDGPLRGFHEIESIMQAISLYDYLTIETVSDSGIELSGDSPDIPYDENNIVFRAATVFYEATGIKQGAKCHIQKNIPVCAGLAGGSSNAAGMLWGLNKLNNFPLAEAQILRLCEKLGSDLNFCLTGGRQLAKGRGEILEKLPFEEFDVTLVKPKNLAISAREAYTRFDEHVKMNNTQNDFLNDLEWALLPRYKELKTLHDLGLQMSGSGPTYFLKEKKLPFELNGDFEVFEGLKAVRHGVEEAGL